MGRVSSNDLIFRGYTKEEDDHWVAICIDLNIAAQGASPKEATKICFELIGEYLDYVCSAYPNELEKYLYRTAPKEFIDEYKWIVSNVITHKKKEDKEKTNLLNFNIKPSRLADCFAQITMGTKATLTTKDVRKKLRELGFEKVRTKKHETWDNRKGNVVQVPKGNEDIGHTLLRLICSQAGISVNDFLKI